MPQAVREAANRADDMIRQLAESGLAPKPDEAAPEPEVLLTAPEPEAVVADQGVAPEPAAPAPVPDSTQELRHELATAEQRYRSLQGMFNSQAEQIRQLHDIIASMHAAPATPAPQDTPLVGKADEEAFGPELLDVARRIAQQELREQAKKYEQRIAQLEQRQDGVQRDTAATRYEAFLGKLADQVEQTTGHLFDTVNKDPAFEQWIKASPSRFRLFQDSIQAMDTEGALTFFDIYAKQHLSKPETVTPSPVDPRLARQVAPGKSKSTPSPAQQDGAKRQWTRSGIADFYKKVKQYPADTAAALERDIFAAQKEGRVDYLK
jgi:chaperonin cofactor prefoldin